MNTKLIITKMPELINKKGERGKLHSDVKHLLENTFHDIHIQEIDNNVDITIRFYELDGEPITNFIHEWLNYNKDTMEIMVINQVLQMTPVIAQNNPVVEEVEINRTSYIKLSPLGYKKDDSIIKKVSIDGNEITGQKFVTTHIKLKGIKVN